MAAAEAQQVFESPPVHLPIARVPPASRRRTRPARCLAQTQRVFESLPPAARRTVLIALDGPGPEAKLLEQRKRRIDKVLKGNMHEQRGSLDADSKVKANG